MLVLLPIVTLLRLPVEWVFLALLGPIVMIGIFLWRKSRTLPETAKFLARLFDLQRRHSNRDRGGSGFAAAPLTRGGWAIPTSATDVAHLDDSVCGVRRRTVLRLAGRRVGAKRALMVSLLIWAGTVIYAFIGLRNPTLTSFGIPQAELEFWILGVFIAAVLGGSQALSRSCSRR